METFLGYPDDRRFVLIALDFWNLSTSWATQEMRLLVVQINYWIGQFSSSS